MVFAFGDECLLAIGIQCDNTDVTVLIPISSDPPWHESDVVGHPVDGSSAFLLEHERDKMLREVLLPVFDGTIRILQFQRGPERADELEEECGIIVVEHVQSVPAPVRIIGNRYIPSDEAHFHQPVKRSYERCHGDLQIGCDIGDLVLSGIITLVTISSVFG